MLTRTILGIVGITGLAAGVWLIIFRARHRPTGETMREQTLHTLFELDSVMFAFGWATWMGLFGGLVSFSITGQTIV